MEKIAQKETKETLGELIKRLRRVRGLTQAQLAQRAGINQGYFAHIENDRRTGSPENITAIARALGVEPPYRIFAVFDPETDFESSTNALAGMDYLRLPAVLQAEDRELVRNLIESLAERRNLEHDLQALAEIDREMETEVQSKRRSAPANRPRRSRLGQQIEQQRQRDAI